METQTEEIRYLEDYFKQTGWGLYYKFIVGVACASNFARGVTFVTMAYTVALSSCDPIFITEVNALRIFTCYLIGSGIGGLVVNSLSDRYGRKRYLSYSLMCLFFSSFVAAFAYNTFIVIGATLILGVGLESNAVQIRILLNEVLSKEKRGICITFCNIFWTLGYILTTFILLETPTFFNAEKPLTSQLTTWRIMFAVSGGINLVLACVCALIEESPRYYMYVGKNYLAYLLLKQLYAINNSSFAETFKVKEDDLRNLIKSYDLNYLEPESYLKMCKMLLFRFWKSLKLMFSKRFCQTTWILMLLKVPVIVIGLLQLNLSLAKQIALNNPSTASQKFRGLDFIYPVFQPTSYVSEKTMGQSSFMLCEKNDNNSFFYKYVLLLGSAIIPGQIMCMFIVDRLGRKFVLFAGLLLASCSFTSLGFIEQKVIQTIAACVIMASIGGVISGLTLVDLELYPTAIRGTLNGMTSLPGYLLAVIYINLIVIDSQIFNIIFGILYFCISIFVCFLPEWKGKPLVE